MFKKFERSFVMRVFGCVGLSSVVLASALVVGCAQPAGPVVPPGAMQVSSGNKTIAFTAPHDGRVYLRDDNDNSLVYSGDIRRNQMVKFDSAMQQVIVDGGVVSQKVANANHDHSWYFERSNGSDVSEAGPNAAQSGTSEITTIHVPVGVKVDVQTQPSAR